MWLMFKQLSTQHTRCDVAAYVTCRITWLRAHTDAHLLHTDAHLLHAPFKGLWRADETLYSCLQMLCLNYAEINSNACVSDSSEMLLHVLCTADTVTVAP
jgi:hypothetical protein